MKGKATLNQSNKVCGFLGGVHFTMNFFTMESSLSQSKKRQGKLLPQNLLPTSSPTCYSLHFYAQFEILSWTKEEAVSGNNLSSDSAETQTLPVLSLSWKNVPVWCWWEEINSVHRNVTGCTVSKETWCVGLVWRSFGSGGCRVTSVRGLQELPHLGQSQFQLAPKWTAE